MTKEYQASAPDQLETSKFSQVRNSKLVKSSTGAIFIMFFFSLLISCGSKTEEKQAKNSAGPLMVEGYKITGFPFSNEVRASANLYANEQVELKAPFSGQVLEVFFKEGQNINKGGSIIRMDDRSWKAELSGVQAELDATTKDYVRKKKLLEIEGSNQGEIDALFSKIQVLKSKKELLTLNIELANIQAPFSGRLGMRNFSEGAYLKEGENITVLTELDQLKIDFDIPQEYKNSIEIGNKVHLLIENDTFDATVYAINPVINTDSRTINVRARLKQPKNNQIMPGAFAEILISINYVKDALLIPTQAVISEINDQTVYLYKNGKAVKRIIEMGSRTDEKVSIIHGVSAGDTLITTGLLLIKDGMEVILQSVNNPAK